MGRRIGNGTHDSLEGPHTPRGWFIYIVNLLLHYILSSQKGGGFWADRLGKGTAHLEDSGRRDLGLLGWKEWDEGVENHLLPIDPLAWNGIGN